MVEISVQSLKFRVDLCGENWLINYSFMGVLGEPCGKTVQTHTLTQTSPQPSPVNGNVTQLNLTWICMVIHIEVFTMAAPRAHTIDC